MIDAAHSALIVVDMQPDFMPGGALAVAGGLIAGALGGWRAARLRPADALRRLD